MALALALRLVGACSTDSANDAKAVSLPERTVPNAVAAFQSAESPRCGEGDCTRQLRRLVGDIRALGQAMRAMPNGERTYAEPLEIMRSMENDLPGDESAEVDSLAREPARTAAQALKQWITAHPQAIRDR